MTDEPALCALCAWRKDCQKRFLRSKDIQLKCPDFTRDMAIKDTEKGDAEKKDSGDN